MILFKEDIEKMDAVLKKLMIASKAQCTFLVSKDGHLMTRSGESKGLDANTLAALVAGSFASTKAIANILGETEFSVMFHQGDKENIYLSLVSEDAIMIVVFNDKTSIGMIRLYAQQHGKLLSEILAAAENRSEAPPPPAAIPSQRPASNEVDTGSLGAGVEDKLDDLFGGAK